MSTGLATSPALHDLADPEVGALEDKFSALEQEINAVYEHVPFGSHTLLADGTFTHANALELGWLGETLSSLVGQQKFADFLTPQSRTTFERHFSDAFAQGHIDSLALDLVGKDGAVRPVSLSSVGIRNAAGQVIKHRGMCFDMTQARLQEMKERIAASAFESLSGMYVTDSHGVFLQVNKAFSTLTGYTEQDVLGQTTHLLSSGQHDPAFYQALWAALLAHGFWQGEITNRRKDGQLMQQWLNICSVANADGATTHYIGSFIDIIANKAAEAAVSRLAYFDTLTQLPNRKLMHDRIGQALITAQRTGQGGALMLIDLDNFKAVNDTRGHDVGDLLLIEVAQRLQSVVREGDSVARQSGDEFLMLLIGLSPDPLKAASQARQVGEKIVTVLTQPYPLKGHALRCAASIGIDLFGPDTTVSDLLQHADLAMYQAKKEGRGRFAFYNRAMHAALMQRANMEEDLRRGLTQHEFMVFYQPQVNHHGQVVGAEALLRWQHAERGLVPPGEFIALAEDTGLILPIGQWVLETACAQLKTWEELALTQGLELAVNVSPRQFRQSNFVALVQQALHSSGVNPQRLKLELTESMVIDVVDTSDRMRALNALGVRFSMDDFGTGYSSLSSLSKLPLSQLKIDQSFVQAINIRPGDAIIAQTIIAMGQALGMNVIAEGVETPAQRAFLAAHGCLLYQGYLFGRPMPILAFEALLQTHTAAPAAGA